MSPCPGPARGVQRPESPATVYIIRPALAAKAPLPPDEYLPPAMTLHACFHDRCQASAFLVVRWVWVAPQTRADREDPIVPAPSRVRPASRCTRGRVLPIVRRRLRAVLQEWTDWNSYHPDQART